MANDFEKMIWHLDEPIADFSALNVLYISELAKKNGIKVLLSGVGGDDIFTGYRRHQAINLEKYWTWTPIGIRKKIFKSSKLFNNKSTLQRRISKVLKNIYLNKNDRLISYYKWINKDTINDILSQKSKENISNPDVDLSMREFIGKFGNNISDLEKSLLLEQRFFLSDHNLIYTDKMSMANGVEVRVPFLDNEFSDFVKKIPIKYKINGTKTKWILKESMRKYLPNSIIDRKKTGFGVPLRNWMKEDFKELMHSTLSDNSLNSTGIFDPKKVKKLIDENNSGKIDADYTILSMMAIQTWYRKFM